MGELRRKTRQLWKLIWKLMTIIDDQLMISEFILYLTLFYFLWCCLQCLSYIRNSDLFRKRVLCLLGNIFCQWFVNCWQRGGYQVVNCIRDFEENGLWHFNDRQQWICLIFVKLKWFGYLYGGWMFSESVLAGLPFPSRQYFSVILLQEPFQLMSKFTRYRLYIFSDTVCC